MTTFGSGDHHQHKDELLTYVCSHADYFPHAYQDTGGQIFCFSCHYYHYYFA